MAKERIDLFSSPNWKKFEPSYINRKGKNKTLKQQLTLQKPFKLRFSAIGVQTLSIYCYENLIKRWGDRVCLNYVTVDEVEGTLGLCLLFSKQGIPDKRSNKFQIKDTSAPRVGWARSSWEFNWRSGENYETDSMSSYTENGVTEVQIIFKREE
jgi:hypothetical protein